MTPLSQMLTPERVQKKTADTAKGSILGPNQTFPLMGERRLKPQSPLLVTNSRGGFVVTKVSESGIGRYGFSEIDLEDEDILISELYHVGLERSPVWGNRAKTLDVGLILLSSLGHQPRTVLLAETREIEGVEVYTSDALPKDAAIIATTPALTGHYTRCGDHVGVQILNPQETLVFVCP